MAGSDRLEERDEEESSVFPSQVLHPTGKFSGVSVLYPEKQCNDTSSLYRTACSLPYLTEKNNTV